MKTNLAVRLGMLVVSSLAATAALGACAAPEESTSELKIKKASQASSVAIDLLDARGAKLGSCSGALVAPQLVLTAGHCTSRAVSFRVEAPSVGASSSASIAVSPWKDLGADAHAHQTDIALLRLDKSIQLEAYPKIATAKVASDTPIRRFYRSSAASDVVAADGVVSDGATKGFRLEYLVQGDGGAFVDTGGVVADARSGEIIGVVSGRGRTSGLIHVARIDGFASWIASSEQCASIPSLNAGTKSWNGSEDPWGGSGQPSNGPGMPPGSQGPGGWNGQDGGPGQGGYGGDGPGIDAGSLPETPPNGPAQPPPNGGSCPPAPSCNGNDCPSQGGPAGPNAPESVDYGTDCGCQTNGVPGLR